MIDKGAVLFSHSTVNLISIYIYMDNDGKMDLT